MNQRKPCNTCPDFSDYLKGGKSFQYFHFSTPLTTLLTGQTANVNIPIYSDSYFVLKKLTSTQSGTFLANLINGATGRVFSSAPVGNANIFGTIQFPNRLADPVIMPPSSNIQLQITDTSGLLTNVVQVSLIGYRCFDLKNPPVSMLGGAVLVWYQYVINIPLAGNDTLTGIVRVDADSDFLVRKIVSTQAGAYTIKVSDSGAQDYWTDNEQTNGNIAGTAQLPNFLARPRLVARNNTINVEIRDLSGAPNSVQIVFEGAKVYR